MIRVAPLVFLEPYRRDHYRGSGPDRQRYSREDNIQKIPRLSKNKKSTPGGGPTTRDTERIDDQVSSVTLCRRWYIHIILTETVTTSTKPRPCPSQLSPTTHQ